MENAHFYIKWDIKQCSTDAGKSKENKNSIENIHTTRTTVLVIWARTCYNRLTLIKENGAGYIFQCEDGSSLYYLTEKETLDAWFQEGELYLNIKMTKK